MFIFVNHDDMRGQEVMEELLRRGYYVSDQQKDLIYSQIIYLGGKGIDRKHRLFLHNETVIIDKKIFQKLPKNCWIFTLMHNDYLEELSHVYHFNYAALLDDEEFVGQNSILTAEGLIAYLIAHRRYPLYQSHIDILGYGHCAKAIIKCLHSFDVSLRVGVRNSRDFPDIARQGGQACFLQDMNLSQTDILINTIPSHVIGQEKLDQANKQIMIVDIASYPYGIDHHYALSQGLHSQILSSIPCKYAYGQAGKMVVDFIERKMTDA